jgi:hypothetical protein
MSTLPSISISISIIIGSLFVLLVQLIALIALVALVALVAAAVAAVHFLRCYQY